MLLAKNNVYIRVRYFRLLTRTSKDIHFSASKDQTLELHLTREITFISSTTPYLIIFDTV